MSWTAEFEGKARTIPQSDDEAFDVGFCVGLTGGFTSGAIASTTKEMQHLYSIGVRVGQLVAKDVAQALVFPEDALPDDVIARIVQQYMTATFERVRQSAIPVEVHEETMLRRLAAGVAPPGETFRAFSAARAGK